MAYRSEQVTGLRQPYRSIYLAKAHAGLWHTLSACCATSDQEVAAAFKDMSKHERAALGQKVIVIEYNLLFNNIAIVIYPCSQVTRH